MDFYFSTDPVEEERECVLLSCYLNYNLMLPHKPVWRAMPIVLLGCLLFLFGLQMPSRMGWGIFRYWEHLGQMFPVL